MTLETPSKPTILLFYDPVKCDPEMDLPTEEQPFAGVIRYASLPQCLMHDEEAVSHPAVPKFTKYPFHLFTLLYFTHIFPLEDTGAWIELEKRKMLFAPRSNLKALCINIYSRGGEPGALQMLLKHNACNPGPLARANN